MDELQKLMETYAEMKAALAVSPVAAKIAKLQEELQPYTEAIADAGRLDAIRARIAELGAQQTRLAKVGDILETQRALLSEVGSKLDAGFALVEQPDTGE